MPNRRLLARSSRQLQAARAPVPADPAAQALLRLQRAAGNAAVSGLVGQRRLARKRVLPADPTGLADYGDVRGEISLDTAAHSLGDIKELFRPKGARFNPRGGFDISYHYAQDLAADSEKKDVVQTGLANIARALFHLATTSKGDVKTGATTLMKLNLASVGGHDGRYRFTSVAGAKAKEVEILIEYLGPAPAPLSSWDALGESGRRKLTERFERFGFSWGDGDVGWSYDKKAQIMQALAFIPDSVLNEVSTISWERGRAQTGSDGEAGFYDFDGHNRKIVLYTSAFDDDWGLIEVVAHELGHGLGFRPHERNASAKAHQDESGYQTAAGPLAAAVTEYGRKAWKEDFAEGFALFIEEPDTLKLLRPQLFEYFKRLVAGLPA